VMETSRDETSIIGGTLEGIAFELFRSQGRELRYPTDLDEEMKTVIIRCHSVFTTTRGILDIVHSCLLKKECESQWPSSGEAALRFMDLNSS
jgi:hypothetical protein